MHQYISMWTRKLNALRATNAIKFCVRFGYNASETVLLLNICTSTSNWYNDFHRLVWTERKTKKNVQMCSSNFVYWSILLHILLLRRYSSRTYFSFAVCSQLAYWEFTARSPYMRTTRILGLKGNHDGDHWYGFAWETSFWAHQLAFIQCPCFLLWSVVVVVVCFVAAAAAAAVLYSFC